MSAIKNVIVAGATGNLGPTVIQALLDSGFNVSILTRQSSTATPRPGTKLIQTDYSEASLAEALRGQDAVVSTIGALGTLTQTKLIDAAIPAGVKRFIPSDYAFNTPALGEMEKALPELYTRLKPKTVVLEYLAKQAASHPEFSWTAVGSGPLFDWTLKNSFLGTSIATKTATIIDSGNEPYPTVTRAQIGRAIASVLQRPVETANKYLFITSWITTQNQILQAAESVTKSKWQVNHVTSEQRHKDGLELLAKGNFTGIGNMWNVWCNTDGKGHAMEEGKLANGMLGLPKEDMETVIKEVTASA